MNPGLAQTVRKSAAEAVEAAGRLLHERYLAQARADVLARADEWLENWVDAAN